MSGISLLFSWFPMIFAIFLNEIKCRPFQKIVQTVTTLPNFISWVLVYSIAYCVFNSTGVVNTVGMKLGLIDSPVLFLQSGDHIWFNERSGQGRRCIQDADYLEHYHSKYSSDLLCTGYAEPCKLPQQRNGAVLRIPECIQ